MTSGITSGNNDFSIALWFKPSAQPSTDTINSIHYIGSNLATRATRSSVGVGYENDTDSYYLTFLTPDDNVRKSQTFTTGTWYHIIITYTASSNTVEFFVNNSSLGTETLGGDLVLDPDYVYLCKTPTLT